MTLYELSASYRNSAAVIRLRILELQAEEKLQGDADTVRILHARISALEPLVREMRELAALTEHYYERGYYRNGKYRI